jgi:hypothetical protein
VSKFFCVAALGFMLSIAARAEDLKTPPELTKKIESGIEKLIGKDFEGFLKNFVNPEELAKATEKHPLAAFAESFGEYKAASLLNVLRLIKDKAPDKSEESGAILVWSLDKALIKDALGHIRFQKVGKEWFIMNN